MHCPFCRYKDTKVIDSRLASDGTQVRRRRRCPNCGKRFTTYESAENRFPDVIKRDKRREAFSEDKVRKGIMLACEKRPVTAEMIDKMVGQVSDKVIKNGGQEVTTKAIGEWTMQSLRVVDQVAYVRFASVHENFEEVQRFKDMIERVEGDPTPEMRKNQLPLLADDPDKGTR